MRKLIFLTFLSLSLVAGTAMAEDIKGRFGITGQLGFTVPLDKSNFTSDFAARNGLTSSQLGGDAGFAGGGGLIYGLTRNLAVETGVIYMPSIDYDNSGEKVLEIESIDVAVGLQLRNNVSKDLAAYLGGGIDVLLSDVKDSFGNKGDVDTVVGGHVNVGGDYFITKDIALNLDLRGIFFPEADITGGGRTVAKYDPISFITLFGVRYFLP